MNKVITINLGGNAYQLEESAYDALRAYIKSAESSLADNPDKEEIIKDLESAIATKCTANLASHKTVITLSDMEAALTEMGPVEGEGSSTTHESKESAQTLKRLFRLREGGVIFGVCNGLAAYFNVDVTLVRILFIVLTILTGGGVILAYLLMALIIPRAQTASEFAQASGNAPITAQELVNRAKEGYTNFQNSDEWKNWKQEFKGQAEQWKKDWKSSSKAEHMRKHKMHRQYWEAKDYKGHSVVSEVFGIACATLALTFVGWLLYHNVPLAHDFFSAIHATWNSFMYSLAQTLDQ